MIGIQLLAILFALWMTYFTFLHYRRGEFGKSEVTLWMLLWIGLIAVVLFPHSLDFLLSAFHITRAFDLIVVVGIVVLFAVTFRNYVLLKRTEQRLEDLVRRNALEAEGHQRNPADG